ncbi:MAG: transcriptional regulator [Granulosicoccus sp.]|nr:transcriptional regulator [Granulosicoccus sp.]
MKTRSAELSGFLKSLYGAIAARAQVDSDELRVTEKLMQALRLEQPSVSPNPVWLPVCALLDEAVECVTQAKVEQIPGQSVTVDSSVVDHAQALRNLAPQLRWWHRPDAAQHGKPFADGHANTTVIGKGGLEEHDDVWVGISLLAPGIQYPEHHHPPEEVYLVLSRGHWQQGGGDWYEPGIGGLVHNPPDILHAMRSGSTPLLATWCLWKAH